MARLSRLLLPLLGMLLLTLHGTSAFARVSIQNPASGFLTVTEQRVGETSLASADRVEQKTVFTYELASDFAVAARGTAQLTGQLHHGISRTVHKALEQNPSLRGVYTARDSRFVTQAKDLASHRGYDTFHRNLDAEVAGWVRGNPNATPAQFESYLQGVYQRPDVLARFPNGL